MNRNDYEHSRPLDVHRWSEHPEVNSFDVTVIFDIIGQEFPTQEYSFLLEATR